MRTQESERFSELSERVDRIVSEMTADTVVVLVQFGGENVDVALQKASDEIDRRRAFVSARDLVNEIPDFEPAVARANAPARSRATAKGATSRSPAEKSSAYSSSDLRSGSQQLLDPFLKSDWFLATREKNSEPVSTKGSSRKSQPRRLPTHFFASSCAVLTLSKDDLKLLPEQLMSTRHANIFANRRVSRPPVSLSKSESPEVSENKSFTWGLAKTGAMACWGACQARGQGVKVAVLDTGVDPNHPSLKGKIAGFAEFDENGQITKQGIGKAYDSDSHGTHCCGTIVGGNAGGRYIGMAPDAEILSGLVLPAGGGTDVQILAGIDWAIENEANIISMSLGGLSLAPDVMDTYTLAIMNANRLGVPVVVAVGNEGAQTTGSPGNDYFAYTVGATDVEDRAAGFSGGRTQIISESRYLRSDQLPFVYSKPDVTAPGVNVYSSIPDNKYASYNSSSMATPHVAGAFALLMSRIKQKNPRNSTNLLNLNSIPDLPSHQRATFVQDLLTATVRELGEAGQNHRFGYGRIDVLRAFAFAAEKKYFVFPT